jgi:formylglycine-generating enzyme required for sulfatase activity
MNSLLLVPKLLVLLSALALAQVAAAQETSAQSGVSFEWVTVGDPGNPKDPLIGVPSGGPVSPPEHGSVPYVYSISKYETAIGQYTAFLNAVAKSDPHGLYDPALGDLDTIRGISRSGTDGNYVYYVKNVSQFSGGKTSASLPITFVGFLDAVRFVNWLHNGQGNGSTETGAYTISEGQITRVSSSGGNVTITTAQDHTLSVGDLVTISSDFDLINGTFSVTATTNTTFTFQIPLFLLAPRQITGSMKGISATHRPDARYWIPTENEWYKAAYYDPSPEGPKDHYWLYPWKSDVLNGRPANFYNGTYTVTGRPNLSLLRTFLTDVRGFSGAPSYYGTLNQAGNVEEWTEGDAFSGGPNGFIGGPRPRGGHWNGPSDQAPSRMSSFYSYPLDANGPGALVGFRIATVANPPAGELNAGDKIRYYPRAGYNDRMVGGVFEGSWDRFSYTVLHTITQVPPTGWTEVTVNFGDARYLRYRSPNGGNGNVAEIEFYRSGAKVIGAASGTPGSWSGKDNDTFYAAFDANTSTFFDAPQNDGAYVEIDMGSGGTSPQGTYNLTVTNGGGTGIYQNGQRPFVFAQSPPSGQQFVRWTGFTGILDDPSSPNTTATIPGIGVDLWLTAAYKPLAPGTYILTVGSGSGDGTYATGTLVTVSADPPPAGQQFAGWIGDKAILSNPFIATTKAIIPSMNVAISATYSSEGPSDKIRFYPRSGYTNRMVGGIFEGTNEDPVTGPYRTIYTVTSNPPEGWSEAKVSLADDRFSDPREYRYLRYCGPNGSFGNVAEVEFYRNGVKLTGTGFGTPGSWNNSGATFDKALDGDVSTHFDAPTDSGAYAGIDTGTIGPVLGDKVRYYPRSGYTDRMVGGTFEGTNGDPVTGPYTTIHTIMSNPPLGWTEVSVSLGSYRYLRYRGPNNSLGNVAEIEFYRNGVKLTGTGFGTPGSWNNSGATFDKALDGSVATYFDASTDDGAYVGIDTQ